MKTYFLMTALMLGITSITSAQRLEIISMDHLGGDRTEGISPPGVITYLNGNFSVTVGSNSTTGSINTACVQSFPDGGRGGGILLTYNNDYSTLLGQFCIPRVSRFRGQSTYYFYPQPNGDTIFIGQRDTAGRSYDIGIERRDASGNALWTKFYGGTGSDAATGVARGPGGGFYVAGGTNSTDGDVGFHYGSTGTADMWVIRLDNNGDTVWTRVIGGTESDLVRDLHPAADGGCYIFGVTTSDDFDATGNHGASDLLVVKLDSLGHKTWHRCYGGSGDDGSGYDLGIKAVPDGQGGFYVLNRTDSKDGDVQQRLPDDLDFWLLHIDSAGNILWENTYGGAFPQYPSALCRGADGSLWMGGYFYGGTPISGQIDIVYGNTDCWVVHADSQGNFLGQRVLGANQAEEMNMLYPLPDGSVIAGGQYRTNAGDRSPGFPETTEGSTDIFLARIGPGTVGIEDRDAVLPIWSLYPNPATKKVTIEVSTPGSYEISITSATGQKVYTGKLKDRLTLDTVTWPPGLYLVSLRDKKGVKSTKKLTIQH